jgi:predicted transcriptional regulator of viral defense system
VGRNDDILRRRSGPVDDRAVAAVALRQHGIVSLAQLRALGLGPRGAQHRVSAGRLHRLHRGVYAVGHRAVGADGRRMAAVLACGPAQC